MITSGDYRQQMQTEHRRVSARHHRDRLDAIQRFSVRDKRLLFSIMRNLGAQHQLESDVLFVEFGVTAGQFTTSFALGDTNRSKDRKKKKPPKDSAKPSA